MVTVKVWDPFVRIFHWSLVFCFTVAWISADEWQDLHEVMGYITAGLVVFRILWGLIGPRYARFTHFVRSPGTVMSYLKSIKAGNERRHVGHNPAGGMMVVALLLSLAALTLSGWLSTDILWGESWIQEVHELAGNMVLLLVALHLAGVLLASLRHRENLPRAMVTGHKRPAVGADQD